MQPPVTSRSDGRSQRPLFIVLGYDGTPSAQAALKRSAQLVAERPGHLIIVYVERPSVVSALAPQMASLIRQNNASLMRTIDAEVRTVLEDREPRWSSLRRRGSVAAQPRAVADQVRTTHGGAVDVVIAAAHNAAAPRGRFSWKRSRSRRTASVRGVTTRMTRDTAS